ncbi:MAG TPA: hypothetical protein VHY20_08975, partial [Pirellulales bacterium]|nr:hypothetical protein [Pirellulales bacterium]
MSDPSPRRSGPSIWMKIWLAFVYLCYDLRNSLNLFGDGLPSEAAPARRQRRTASLRIRIAMGLARLPQTCVRMAVGLMRQSARFGRRVRWWVVYAPHSLLDLCYVLGLSPLSDWIDTRRIWSPKTALGVLPIVVFALVATVLGARMATMDARELPIAYAAAARDALEQNDNPAASVYLQRLIELDPRNAPAVYELALCVDAQGEVQRGVA